MALRRQVKRRRASITSLIDVIFLLLLFFMLASTYSKQAEIELVSAAESPSEADPPPIFNLLVLAQGLQYDGRPIVETELGDALRREMTEPNSIIALELDEDVTTQRLIEVLLTLRRASSAQIRVLEPS